MKNHAALTKGGVFVCTFTTGSKGNINVLSLVLGVSEKANVHRLEYLNLATIARFFTLPCTFLLFYSRPLFTPVRE